METLPTLSFNAWISRHTKRDSPLGDLAQDYLATNEEVTTRKELLDHLIFRRACSGAMRAGREAWTAYRSYCKRKGFVVPS